MAGHSKWSNIKHRKKKQDKKKAKLFARLVKEITAEARNNPDPEENPTLASAIERAKEANMPKENIQKAIKRATGELEGQSHEKVIYEGYGPGSVAIIVKAMTDNRNRTSTNLKKIFKNHGGELGEDGCVRWMFQREGRISVRTDNLNGTDPDSLQLEAIEGGAEEIEESEEKFIISCQPADLAQLNDRLESLCEKLEAEVLMKPNNYASPTEEEKERALALLGELEEEEDVEEVFHNLGEDPH